jgi:hypothetical protein
MTSKKFVPHQISFNHVERLNKANNIILILSTLIVVAATFFDQSINKFDGLSDGLNALNTLIIFCYILLDITGAYLLHKAEAKRRLDFIDNSFDTNLSGRRSENYFTNSFLSPGLYKMAVNCFESSLFSFNISKRMLPGLIVKNFIIMSVFVIAASMGEKRIVIMIFQLSLPLLLFQQLVKLLLYIINTESVLLSFQSLFNDLKTMDLEYKSPEILRNIIHYESNVSWGSLQLSARIFNKLNPSLSAEWERLRSEYKIANRIKNVSNTVIDKTT